jgi:hypothetical protein
MTTTSALAPRQALVTRDSSRRIAPSPGADSADGYPPDVTAIRDAPAKRHESACSGTDDQQPRQAPTPVRSNLWSGWARACHDQAATREVGRDRSADCRRGGPARRCRAGQGALARAGRGDDHPRDPPDPRPIQGADQCGTRRRRRGGRDRRCVPVDRRSGCRGSRGRLLSRVHGGRAAIGDRSTPHVVWLFRRGGQSGRGRAHRPRRCLPRGGGRLGGDPGRRGRRAARAGRAGRGRRLRSGPAARLAGLPGDHDLPALASLRRPEEAR